MSTDWIPSEVMSVGARSMVRWIHPGTQVRFDDPFFGQTIDKLVAANAVQKLTPLEGLADVRPVRTPRGFIFHVSRCGSTLVSRSLAAVPRHRVISEAAAVNQLLLAHSPDQQLLKGLVHALCGTDADTDCFIKFSSWNLLFLEQILALFPATPWVFVYRAPADVMRSLNARPPRWAGNQALARLMDNPHAEMAQQTLATLARVFQAPLPHWSRRALAINYAQLPGAMAEITAHFGLQLDAADQSHMVRMGQYDAKQSGEITFQARAREALPDHLLDALGPLNALYEQWEAIRMASQNG